MNSGTGPQLRVVAERDPNEERALLMRVQAGDHQAFRVLVERHLPRVVALARRMLRDAAEADDVAQETMLRLWRTGASVDVGPAGVRPWLARVAANLCIDRARRKGRLKETDEVPEIGVAPDQLSTLESAELAGRVDGAMKELPERQRQALSLFHYEGLSHLEIGTVMGITDVAVESLLARARRALKMALAEDWKNLQVARD